MAFSDYVTSLSSLASDAREDLDAALAQMDEIINGMFFFDDFDGSAEVYKDFSIGAAPDSITMPSPTPDLVIPSFDDSDLQEFDPYTIFETGRYDSEFLEELEQTCRSIFAGSIPGFTQAAADALFSYRTERDQRQLQIELDEAAVQFGARRGFPITPDSVAHKQNEIMRRWSHTSADRTRETTALLAERITDMTKHAMSVGVNIEEVRSRMYVAIGEMLTAKIRAQVDAYRAKIAGLVAEFEGDISLIRTEADIAQANGNLDNQYKANLINKTLGLRRLRMDIVNREYDEVRDISQLRVDSAKAITAAWERIYTGAALGTQTLATEAT